MPALAYANKRQNEILLYVKASSLRVTHELHIEEVVPCGCQT